jgi:DNA-binding LytR/AlgR family response regulator
VMKVLIVEDETAAFENLVEILKDIDPEIKIAGNTESVVQTVDWLQANPEPDLILMDIHLSDGSAFSIFEIINVETPIIFTTAYDEYAIEAFKVNSLDYLLKPVKSEELERAIHKFNKWTKKEIMEYLSKLPQLTLASRYKDRLLIPLSDHLLPVDLQDVSCFYTTEKLTKVFLKTGKSYPYSKTLEQIFVSLNPAHFFRANKQFIVSRNSVENITIWFDNRLLITLDVEVPERIYISKNKASEFKAWMVQQ